MEELDDEDEIFKKVQEESLRYFQEFELPRLKEQQENSISEEIEQVLPKSDTDPLRSPCTPVCRNGEALLYDGEEARGFYIAAGANYIYPTNYPIRQYQMNIVRSSLFKNTLVSLPTGLGKTFIAAVVMYNYYRWYPQGKVVFMAPTRPLVAQQIKACHHIMNIPYNDTTEMTGTLSAQARALLWKEKRVFFLTPQVLVNDLRSSICCAYQIKCLVVDEAHRAMKDYAYCQVVKLLEEAGVVYRILALSATPGNDVNAVQQVIQNLKISALELRGEDALDVAPYTHSRSVESCIVEASINIQRVKQDFLQVYEKYARKLKDFKALPNNISMISKFQVLKACEKFRANPPRGVPASVVGSVISDFTVCMSMAHALDLLQIYGLRAFYNFLKEGGSDKTKAAATRLLNDQDLKKILDRLGQILSPPPGSEGYIWGHPKYQKLVTVLRDHFQKNEEDGGSTRAIIFCEYRVVVNEVVDILNTLKPQIRPVMFIGQSGGKDKGMPQAKQLEIMKGFRSGQLNCLVATCVAEEGLDIGDVDLIILVEAHKSITRLVQRMGRTGRKRKGHCMVLLTKGKEEHKFNEVMASRKSYVSNILNSKTVRNSLFQDCPRMLPPGIKPEKELVHINPEIIDTPVKPSKKQIDIRDCLVDASSPFLSNEEYDLVVTELGKCELNFRRIPPVPSCNLWHRITEEPMRAEELLQKNLDRLSEWIDWNREESFSFQLNHSVKTNLLCSLLNRSGKPYFSSSNFKGTGCKSLSNMIGSITNSESNSAAGTDETNTTEEMAAVKVTDIADKKVKKQLSKPPNMMDIRQCMAAAAEKIKNSKVKTMDNLDPVDLTKEPSSSYFEDVIFSIRTKFNTSWIDHYDNISKCDDIMSPFHEEKQFCDVLMFTVTLYEEKIVLDEVESLPNISSFCRDMSKMEDIGDSADLKLSKPFHDHEIENPRNLVSPTIPNYSSSLNCKPEILEVEDIFSEESIGFVCIDDLFNEARIDGREKLNGSPETLMNKTLVGQSFDSSDEIIEKKIENNLTSNVYEEGKLCELSEVKKCPKVSNSFCREKLRESTPNKIPLSISSGNKSFTETMGENLGREEKYLENFQQNIDPSFKGGSVESKIDIMDDFLNNGIISSTPLLESNSKNKDKKSRKCLLPIYETSESKKSPEYRTCSESNDNIWNLSDLFEEEDDKNKEKNESTMLGITQLVSIIERDKENLEEPHKDVLQNSKDVFIEEEVACKELPLGNVGDSSVLKTEGSRNETKLPSLLEMDDDIFVGLDDLFGDNSENKPAHIETTSEKLKSNSTTEKNECPLLPSALKNNVGAAQNDEQLPRVKNFKRFSSAKSKLNLQKGNCVTHDLSLLPESQNDFQVCPKVETSLRPSKKHLLSLKGRQSSQEYDVASSSSHQKPENDESQKFDFEYVKNLKYHIQSNAKCFKIGTPNSKFVNGVSDQERKRSAKKMERRAKERKLMLSGVDDEEIFKKTSLDMSVKMSPIIRQRKERRKLEKEPDCPYIEREADESGSGSSDDEDGRSLDGLDASFIDDKSPEMNIHSRYLQSVKSPVIGKFKIPEPKNYPKNIYSQIEIDPNSEYINDSFCVDSDDEYSSQNEPSLLELAERKLKKRRGKRKKRKHFESSSSEGDCLTSEDEVNPKKFKRIKRLEDSSEEY